MSGQRFQKAEFAAWIGIIGNLLLAVMKGSIGWLAHSKALMADAVHSVSDVASSVAVLVGLRTARQTTDEDHTYGQGKAKFTAAIIVSVILLVLGIEAGISALKSIYYSTYTKPNESMLEYALGAILVSLMIKEAMFRFQYRLGKKLSSHTLIAITREHRSDVYSSIAAFIGVVGGLYGRSLGFPQLNVLDPIAGLFIAVLVFRMGFKLVMESIHQTKERILHREDAAELLITAQKIKGVITVDELRAREHGHYVIVDMKISVNPRISVQEGHEIARLVKQQLMQRFIHVSDVFIHVNPYDPGYPYKNNVHPDEDDFPSLLH